jgi:hypothetical protein
MIGRRFTVTKPGGRARIHVAPDGPFLQIDGPRGRGPPWTVRLLPERSQVRAVVRALCVVRAMCVATLTLRDWQFHCWATRADPPDGPASARRRGGHGVRALNPRPHRWRGQRRSQRSPDRYPDLEQTCVTLFRGVDHRAPDLLHLRVGNIASIHLGRLGKIIKMPAGMMLPLKPFTWARICAFAYGAEAAARHSQQP